MSSPSHPNSNRNRDKPPTRPARSRQHTPSHQLTPSRRAEITGSTAAPPSIALPLSGAPAAAHHPVLSGGSALRTAAPNPKSGMHPTAAAATTKTSAAAAVPLDAPAVCGPQAIQSAMQQRESQFSMHWSRVKEMLLIVFPPWSPTTNPVVEERPSSALNAAAVPPSSGSSPGDGNRAVLSRGALFAYYYSYGSHDGATSNNSEKGCEGANQSLREEEEGTSHIEAPSSTLRCLPLRPPPPPLQRYRSHPANTAALSSPSMDAFLASYSPETVFRSVCALVEAGESRALLHALHEQCEQFFRGYWDSLQREIAPRTSTAPIELEEDASDGLSSTGLPSNLFTQLLSQGVPDWRGLLHEAPSAQLNHCSSSSRAGEALLGMAVLQSLSVFWRDWMFRWKEIEEVWSGVPRQELRQWYGETHLVEVGCKWVRGFLCHWAVTPSSGGSTSLSGLSPVRRSGKVVVSAAGHQHHPSHPLRSASGAPPSPHPLLGGTTAAAAMSGGLNSRKPDSGATDAGLHVGIDPDVDPLQVIAVLDAQTPVMRTAVMAYLHVLLHSLRQQEAEEELRFEATAALPDSASTPALPPSTTRMTMPDTAVPSEGVTKRQREDGEGWTCPHSKKQRLASPRPMEAATVLLQTVTDLFTRLHLYFPLVEPLLRECFRCYYLHRAAQLFQRRLHTIRQPGSVPSPESLAPSGAVHFVHAFAHAIAKLKQRCVLRGSSHPNPWSDVGGGTTPHPSSSELAGQHHTENGKLHSNASSPSSISSTGPASANTPADLHPDSYAHFKRTVERALLLYYQTPSFQLLLKQQCLELGDRVEHHPFLGPRGFEELMGENTFTSLRQLWVLISTSCCTEELHQIRQGFKSYVESKGMECIHHLRHYVRGPGYYAQYQKAFQLWSRRRKELGDEEHHALETPKAAPPPPPLPPPPVMITTAPSSSSKTSHNGPNSTSSSRSSPTSSSGSPPLLLRPYQPMQTILGLLQTMRRGEEAVQWCFLEEQKSMSLVVHEGIQSLLGMEPELLSEELAEYADTMVQWYDKPLPDPKEVEGSTASLSTTSVNDHRDSVLQLENIFTVAASFYPSSSPTPESLTSSYFTGSTGPIALDEEEMTAGEERFQNEIIHLPPAAAGNTGNTAVTSVFQKWICEALWRAADLCTFLTDKNFFRHALQRGWARRLLPLPLSNRVNHHPSATCADVQSPSCSLAGAHLFVEALHTRCGQGFTSVFLTMLREYEAAGVLSRLFSEWCEKGGRAEVRLPARLRGDSAAQQDDSLWGEESGTGNPSRTSGAQTAGPTLFHVWTADNEEEELRSGAPQRRRRRREEEEEASWEDVEEVTSSSSLSHGDADDVFNGFTSNATSKPENQSALAVVRHLPHPLPELSLFFLGRSIWPTFKPFPFYFNTPQSTTTMMSAPPPHHSPPHQSDDTTRRRCDSLFSWCALWQSVTHFYHLCYPSRRIEWAPQLSRAVLRLLPPGGISPLSKVEVELHGDAVQCAVLFAVQDAGAEGVMVQTLCDLLIGVEASDTDTSDPSAAAESGRQSGRVGGSSRTSAVAASSVPTPTNPAARLTVLAPFLQSLRTPALPILVTKRDAAVVSSSSPLGLTDVVCLNPRSDFWSDTWNASVPLPATSSTRKSDHRPLNTVEEGYHATVRVLTLPKPSNPELRRALRHPGVPLSLLASHTSRGGPRDEEAGDEREGDVVRTSDADLAEQNRLQREKELLAQKVRLFQLEIGVTRVLKSCPRASMQELEENLRPASGLSPVYHHTGGGSKQQAARMKFPVQKAELKTAVERLVDKGIIRRCQASGDSFEFIY